MILTEQEISQREEDLLGLIEAIAEDMEPLAEDYEMTEEDAYIASIVMEHFVEHYKQPSLREATVMSLMGFDINDELYEEVIDMLLDESIGTFVAGAAHGIRNAISKFSASRAASSAKKAKMQKAAITTKYKTASKALKKSPTSDTVMGGARSGFQQSKVAGMGDRAQKASDKAAQTLSKQRSTQGKYQANVQKSTNLANKIDTGVTNVKNKVTGAVKSGARKFGSALGKIAGRFA
jgi:predicted nucleic-acid-binding protein